MRAFGLLLTYALVGVCLGAKQTSAGDIPPPSAPPAETQLSPGPGPPPAEPKLSPDPGSTSPGKEPTFKGKTIGQWIALAKDNHPAVQQEAVKVLENLGPAAIPALTELLKDKDVEVRFVASWALGNIGPDAKKAVPALTKLLRDKDRQIREVTAKALGKIGPEAKTAVRTLTELLKDGDEPVRKAAAEAVGKIGPAAIPALTELLKDKGSDKEAREAAAGLLEKIGSAAIPALTELLRDRDENVYWAAVDDLGKIGPAAVPAAMGLLKDKDWKVRWAAASVLAKIGPEAKSAIPALTELLNDKDVNVRRIASEALEKIKNGLPFDTYSGYFVSNKFEPDADQSFVVLQDQKQFDAVFGAAFVMHDRSYRLPKDAFKSNIVLAAVKRGKGVWQFEVQSVTETKGVVELKYKTASKKSDTATFACPLIVSIPKGDYRAVQFIENGKAVRKVAVSSAAP